MLVVVVLVLLSSLVVAVLVLLGLLGIVVLLGLVVGIVLAEFEVLVEFLSWLFALEVEAAFLSWSRESFLGLKGALWLAILL